MPKDVTHAPHPSSLHHKTVKHKFEESMCAPFLEFGSTRASMEQCPLCLGLFPVSELVAHSELCSSSEVLVDGTVVAHVVTVPGSSSGEIEFEQCIH